MKKETDKQITEYFSKSNIPPINEKTIERLKKKTENLKPSSLSSAFKRIAIATTCFAIIFISVLIPILNNKNPVYYSDIKTNEQSLSLENAQELISQNYSKYTFIFEDFTILKIRGVYSNDENKLLGVRIEGEKNDIPFSTLNFCLAINKNYIPTEREDYLFESEREDKGEYILHKKEKSDLLDTILYGVMDYKTYTLYIRITAEDYEMYNNFL